MSIITKLKRLQKDKLINPPKWLIDNCHYIAETGSVSYGCSRKDSSDNDICGFTIEPIYDLFPHLDNKIYGFDNIQRFEQWQQHHIKDNDKEYDFAIYGLMRFFKLALDNNPNILDVLNVNDNNVLHCTQIGKIIRDNRKIFFHKGAFVKMRSYAHSQMCKLDSGARRSNEKRQADIENFGYDLKFGYHVVRLCLEAEQIIMTGELNLTRDSEIYKAIRRGEWSLEQLKSYYYEKEKALEIMAANSKAVPDLPRTEEVKNLLLNCIEIHYGNIEKFNYVKSNKSSNIINDLEILIGKYK